MEAKLCKTTFDEFLIIGEPCWDDKPLALEHPSQIERKIETVQITDKSIPLTKGLYPKFEKDLVLNEEIEGCENFLQRNTRSYIVWFRDNPVYDHCEGFIHLCSSNDNIHENQSKGDFERDSAATKQEYAITKSSLLQTLLADHL